MKTVTVIVLRMTSNLETLSPKEEMWLTSVNFIQEFPDYAFPLVVLALG